MMRRAILHGVSAVAACAAIAVAAGAEEGAGTEKLEKAIENLRKEYLAKLDAQDDDHELRNLLRDLNAARNKGDWTRVAALLATRGIDFGSSGGASTGAGATGGNPADELWPVRTEPGPTSKPEDNFEIEEVKYATVNGLSIRALVYRPKAATGKSPVIVLGHDGFRGIGVAARRLAADLAGVGYIVYVPEFRGQVRSEGKIEWAQGEVFDLLAAVEEAKKVTGADAGRIGLVGAGHGGAVVLIALARAEDIKCAATISAPTDLVGLARQQRFVRELEFLRVPFDAAERDELLRRSPLYYVGGIKAPVLVLHGVRDTMVPVKFADQYLSAVKNRGKEIKLEKYGLSDQDLVSKLSVYRVDLHNFLATYLKPPGWKIAKGGKAGGTPQQQDGGQQPDPRRERRRRN